MIKLYKHCFNYTKVMRFRVYKHSRIGILILHDSRNKV